MHHTVCMVHGKPGDGQAVRTPSGQESELVDEARSKAGEEREKAWHGPAGTRRCPGLTPPASA